MEGKHLKAKANSKVTPEKKDKKSKNKFTIGDFVPWLHEKTGAHFKNRGARTECVIDIAHVEPGCFAALYVLPSTDGLAVFELTDHFPSEDAAWQALEARADHYPPLIFEEWVGQQYLTDKNAKVEKLDLI